MNKKQYLGLLILVTTIFVTLFYWYSLRPSAIKQDCYNKAKESAGNVRSEYYQREFKACLDKNGL